MLASVSPTGRSCLGAATAGALSRARRQKSSAVPKGRARQVAWRSWLGSHERQAL